MVYLDWLSTVNQFDWSTGPAASQKQKRAVPNYYIAINCQPEELNITVNNDYPNGIYRDPVVGEYSLITPAMDACRGSVDADDPILLVQKSVVGRYTFYTIFICAAAKSIEIFEPDLNIYHWVQGFANVVSSTVRSQRGQTQWNLGPDYALKELIMFDTMFLAALYSIAQESASYSVYSPLGSGELDLWYTTFQAGTQYWNNPSESYQ